MRKKLIAITMGILTSMILASAAHATSEAKFVFRMPGSKVVAAVAPTEPEELRPFALDQLSFAYKSIPSGSEIEVQISVKNDSDHLASIIFHDLVFAGIYDSGSTSIYCDAPPKTKVVCTSSKSSTGVSSRKIYADNLTAPGVDLHRYTDAALLPPDFNVQ
ncbi:hypothetical protein [Pseudochrobactrum asaccharolyticum]|uniref:hypothetical protein n=1 Tax=Pseudochrobactrum asaccharolyticum TaxID=354351 RepID=UPI0040418EC7